MEYDFLVETFETERLKSPENRCKAELPHIDFGRGPELESVQKCSGVAD
jgi:hypothetical protein